MTRALPFLLLAAASLAAHAQTEGTCMATGGKAALDKLFEQELHYPAVALEAGIKGEVVVTARLAPNGEVRSLRVGKALSPECDAEALRVARMVLWRPATAGELCSGQEQHLAIPFEPGRHKRWAKERKVRTGERFTLPADTSRSVHAPKQVDSQVQPAIPNGMSGLPSYIAREMRYPAEAMRYSLDGTVKAEFVVEPTGSVTNMHVLQDVGGGCTDEALRLLYRIPWEPGIKDGQRVRSSIQVSIRFDLPKERR
ncbi:MAG: energy transducer TonB [Flavobacteriales bacterium]|nr:MAG: energy transducer TonB [Flavobacteriales bacterium]